MAKNEQPVFTRAPIVGMGTVSVANANRDGTGTIVSIVDGGTDGIRIDQIEIKAIVTTTAGMIRLFISEDAGVTWELWREVEVTAVTPTASVQAFSARVDLTTALNDVPLMLPGTSHVLGAATNNAEEMNIFARGGSFAA